MFRRIILDQKIRTYIYTYAPMKKRFEVFQLHEATFIAFDEGYMVGRYATIDEAYEGIKFYLFGIYPPAA